MARACGGGVARACGGGSGRLGLGFWVAVLVGCGVRAAAYKGAGPKSVCIFLNNSDVQKKKEKKY